MVQIDRLTAKDIRDCFSRSIATEDGATFVAAAQGKIVGYTTLFVRTQPDLWRVKRVGRISGLMVSRDYRRRGIATTLLAEAIAFFRKRGIKYLTTHTAVANQAAIEFYERSGTVPLHITFISEVSRE